MKKGKIKVNLRGKSGFGITFHQIIVLAMVHKADVVPQAIELFNTYYISVLAYLTTNAVRLGIDAGDITALAAHMNDVGTGWKDLHTKHSGVSTKTKTGNADLADMERTVTKLLHEIYKKLDRRIMTNTDFETLGIAKPVEHYTKRAKITDLPFAIMYSQRGAVMHFIVRVTEDAGHASMHPLADEIEIRGIFLAVGDAIPVDPAACPIVFTSTSAIIDHQFLVADAGKKFYGFIRYKNSADETKSGSWIALAPAIVSL